MKLVVSDIMKFNRIVFFFLIVTSFLKAQIVQEERIAFKEVPEKIQIQINALPPSVKKLAFFKTVYTDSVTYKARLKSNKTTFQFLFSTHYKLTTVSAYINKKEIPKAVVKSIKTDLKTHYKSFNLFFIEKVYNNTLNHNYNRFLQAILSGSTALETQYKIVAEVKTFAKKRKAILIYYNTNGKRLTQNEIQLYNYDYLLY